ncbi:hypothetical protein NQ317_004057 [Molorchus minor]|uniref:Uncharacterized protein n=1 Tax=Molorchus minor TaxID=1323400 RepID=A0ABQ9IRP2_9CUCU|nr:hypothetical protein NQ317_004057 [Molorchus minor]
MARRDWGHKAGRIPVRAQFQLQFEFQQFQQFEFQQLQLVPAPIAMHLSSSEPELPKPLSSPSTRVWCGIINNKIIGPIFFNGNLNDLPLGIIRNIVWQEDGAPSHNVMNVCIYLDEHYEEWIGKYGTIRWPPKSPDLTLLDTFLWSYLKNKIYDEDNLTLDIIRERINQRIRYLNNNPHILQHVIQNLIKRYRLCIAQNGGHFGKFIIAFLPLPQRALRAVIDSTAL